MHDGLVAPMKFMVGNEEHRTIGAGAVNNRPIPTMQNGKRPKYVACSHNGGAPTLLIPVRIAFGANGGALVVATSGFAIPAHEVVIFDVSGFDTYAVIGGTDFVDFTIVPLENF